MKGTADCIPSNMGREITEKESYRALKALTRSWRL